MHSNNGRERPSISSFLKYFSYISVKFYLIVFIQKKKFRVIAVLISVVYTVFSLYIRFKEMFCSMSRASNVKNIRRCQYKFESQL